MGILQQNTTLLSMIRAEIIRENRAIFEFGGNSFDRFISPQLNVSFTLGLEGSKIDLLDEGSNTVAIGVALNEIKIKDFQGGGMSDYKESDIVVKIRPDFASVNKSDTHMIMYRLKFAKNTVEVLYDKSVSTVKRIPVSDIYGFGNIRDIFHMGKNTFPFRRYVNAYAGSELIV